MFLRLRGRIREAAAQHITDAGARETAALLFRTTATTFHTRPIVAATIKNIDVKEQRGKPRQALAASSLNGRRRLINLLSVFGSTTLKSALN